MANVRLFDGAMGSPSGIGLVTENLEYPQEELLRIASILYFLKEDGIQVFRANMSTKPDAFWSEPNLLDKMMEEGNSILPVWYDGQDLLWSGRYPTTEEVAAYYQSDTLANGVPELPEEEFKRLWAEAEAWGMCSMMDCSSCAGCG